MTLPLTTHATIRLQQSGIAPWFVDLLVRHGDTAHDDHGATLKYVSKATRRRLAQVLTRHEYARAERWFDVYAVVSHDQCVVTAAHRTRRHLH